MRRIERRKRVRPRLQLVQVLDIFCLLLDFHSRAEIPIQRYVIPDLFSAPVRLLLQLFLASSFLFIMVNFLLTPPSFDFFMTRPLTSTTLFHFFFN